MAFSSSRTPHVPPSIFQSLQLMQYVFSGQAAFRTLTSSHMALQLLYVGAASKCNFSFHLPHCPLVHLSRQAVHLS